MILIRSFCAGVLIECIESHCVLLNSFSFELLLMICCPDVSVIRFLIVVDFNSFVVEHLVFL